MTRTRNTARLAVTLLGLLLLGAAASMPLRIARPWSRATAPGATVGVVYLEITNTGPADDLIGIESAAAARVEMHATTMADGMMHMRRTESVSIPARASVRFEPNGLHIMLVDLKKPLTEGEHVPLTLVFRSAGRVSVSALVQGLGADAPPSVLMAQPAPANYRLSVWPPRAQSPDFNLIDADGRVRTLADYHGRVVVMFFGFVHCPDVCPAELFKLAAVLKKMGPLGARVQVLFVTLDPQRDTPKLLKGYVDAFDPRFVGLTGSTTQIDAAAANFFVVYARVGRGTNYTIDHSTSTFVLDVTGRLRLVGAAKAGIDDYAHDLAMLAAE